MIATLKKARGVLLPDNIDKKLAVALAEVARLNQRYESIRSELAGRTDWSMFEARRKRAADEYGKDPRPENIEALVMAEMILERVQDKLVPLHRAFAYGNGAQLQFAKEFPDWRAKLFMACELRLEKAKAELEGITAAERERLGGEFDDDEIEHSPPVRRAASVVQQWEGALQRIASAVPEVVWSQNVAFVLGDE